MAPARTAISWCASCAIPSSSRAGQTPASSSATTRPSSAHRLPMPLRRGSTRLPETGRDEAPGSLHAAMPGIVIRVLVEVGQHVDEGQELLVLEAMKMEHRIVAPRAGTVTEITVGQGDSIAAGILLAILEEDGDG